MITVYGFGRVHMKVSGEPRVLRVEWALEETGLPYRVRPLDHTGGELNGDAYSRISPFHQIPVVDDNGFVVAESAAILLYLAEKAGKLIPDDVAGRTRVTQWCFAALTTVDTSIVLGGLACIAGIGVLAAAMPALIAYNAHTSPVAELAPEPAPG